MEKTNKVLENASAKFMGEVDADELTCRIMEAVLGMKRPNGMTGTQALNSMPPKNAEEIKYFKQGALAAMYYWQECIKTAQQAN